MHNQYLHPADQLTAFMQRIYDKGLTTTSGGNLSIMDEAGALWITPSSIDKGSLRWEDIVCLHPDGGVEGLHKPSIELPFHQAIYRLRPDLKAVLHAHPPVLNAFSIVRKTPALDLFPSARRFCPDVKLAAYAQPGSSDLGKHLGQVFASGCDAAILENHGVCVAAADLAAAFGRFEALNHAAAVDLAASRLGGGKPLSEQELRLPQCAAVQSEPMEAASHTSCELALRRTLVQLIHRAYRTGLFTSVGGVCSARLPDGGFVITPADGDRLLLREEDLVLIRQGRHEPGKVPSGDAALHQQIYAAHPGINAIFQAQPVHAMAFAVTDAAFDPRAIPESCVLLREVKKLPYALRYTDPAAFAGALGVRTPVVIAANDCVLTTGDTLLQAFDRLEVLESVAHSILSSATLGPIVRITDEEAADLKVRYHLQD